jgi:hypothetical protein
MVEPLLKWIMKAYSKLCAKFKNKEFNHKDAAKTFNDDKMASIILSDLKKACRLEVRLDSNDSRKRLCRLLSHDEALKEIAKG